MATPTAAASLNKTAYAPGEVMALTVTYGDPDSEPMTVTIVVTDSDGNSSEPAVVTAVIDPLTIDVTDPDRTWTQVSNTGTVAVYQATA